MNEHQLMLRYQEFLVDGMTILPPASLPEVNHDLLYTKAAATYAELKAKPSKTAHLDMLGDQALRQRIPELEALLGAPQLVALLQGILGDDYFVHPHCYLHDAGTRDQGFHQDGNLPWNERGHYRAHRPDWALLFYYPQTVTLDNGPTEVVPGTQYWTKNFERSEGRYHSDDAFDRRFFSEVMNSDDLALRDRRNGQALASLGVPNLERRFVTVPQGSVAICHYDIVHRGSRQIPDQPGRYMFKFFFARTKLSQARGWNKPSLVPVRPELRPVVDDIWRWSDGSALDDVSLSVEKMARSLINGREDQRVAAAYELAHLALQQSDTQASQVTDVLLKALRHNEEGVRRAAAYGIRGLAGGASCVVPSLTDDRVGVRRLAAFALGTEALGDDAFVIATLIERLQQDQDVLVRSNAAYALGQIARASGNNTDALFAALLRHLEPGVEANNTEVAGLPRSTVRQSVAYALLQCAANYPLPQGALGALELLLGDDDRYVAGFAREIMDRAAP